MFCPICHAEYRQGFTQCNDCAVNLVSALSMNESLPRDTNGPDEESVVVVWSGVDPRFFGNLKNALDEAGVEYDENPAAPQLLATVRTDRFQIRVRGADFDAAKKVLGEVSGRGANEDPNILDRLVDSKSTRNPFHLGQPVFNRTADERGPAKMVEQPESDAEDVPEDFVENFDPEDATVEIWAGADAHMAQVFQNCLSNVGIGCVVNTNTGKAHVLVTVRAEKRAREVVREIEEGTPME